jgi:hypothetical protein
MLLNEAKAGTKPRRAVGLNEFSGLALRLLLPTPREAAKHCVECQEYPQGAEKLQR